MAVLHSYFERDNGHVVGIISERDVIRAVSENGTAALSLSVSEVMTRNVVSCQETSAIDEARTRLATETRAVATDPAARERFLRYWRWARFGILPIRWLLLPAIRRQAEAEWKAGRVPC